ncbi:receptor-like protein kinase FERONIA [Malania oleifera]|uniref:receptor-like protein kinase FERONIA n=1 Tax=Malania oleifera TaxID=397392 RepID=UPI0025ADA655|nr:receptor-like protein kinase FERONIA [Malania oleifera]
MTARISRAPFTYSFSLSSGGQKFIRLHFYLSSSSCSDPSCPFFSVKAGPYTLLNNFTATPPVDSSYQQSFFREFCLNVPENQKVLNITFSPVPASAALNVATYAFISGIEIVSMPTNLYYTQAGDKGPCFVGQQKEFIIDNSTALEGVYRLNVGGKPITPVDDSGLFRSWSDDYFFIVSPSMVPGYDSTISYSGSLLEYVAPPEVYKTARTMGSNNQENTKSNLTWELPVDSGFSYLVRLHFCEYQPEVKEAGDRPFIIYMDNQTADDSADVISWSQGNSIPVYKDYILMIGKERNGGKHNLSLALHPNVDAGGYVNVILNGLEMFKLNDSRGNLTGPNPNPSLPSHEPNNSGPLSLEKDSRSKKTLFFVIGGNVIGGFMLFSILCAYHRALWWRQKKDELQLTARKASGLPEKLCRHFSLAELRSATNDFDDAFIIGVGGFGKVYTGCMDGLKLVAIKRLSRGSRQGAHEFATEIQTLSQLRHVHLVSLIGYCGEGQEMILVYDYMINGTLCNHLYETENAPLLWKQRLNICIGAARGLHYLHTGTTRMIIHRDVKSTNILLDENWVAKVSDFGLSKIGPTSLASTAISTVVKGTLGYLDPEYIRRMHLTEKSDVYSFGVVLFEVLCARKAVNRKLAEGQVNLASWAKECIHYGTLHQNIDPYLIGKITPSCFKKFVEIADSCLDDSGIERPTMGNVVGSLEFALQLQESEETSEYSKEDAHYDLKIDQAVASHVGGVSYVNAMDSSHSDLTLSSASTISGLSCHRNFDFDCIISSSEEASLISHHQ